jgi:hypothetical protein
MRVAPVATLRVTITAARPVPPGKLRSNVDATTIFARQTP